MDTTEVEELKATLRFNGKVCIKSTDVQKCIMFKKNGIGLCRKFYS